MGRLDKIMPRGRPSRIALVVLLMGPLCAFSTDWHALFWAAPAAGKDPLGYEKAEVSINTDQQMDFGQLADKDGSVTLGLADTITTDPALIHYGGSPYSGIYTITGDASTAVDISISSTPANGFTLSTFVSSEGAVPLIGVLLDTSGELILTIGATLTVDASTATIGSGQDISFTITSTYN